MLSRLFYFGGYDWFGPIIKIQDVICCEGPARGGLYSPLLGPSCSPGRPPTHGSESARTSRRVVHQPRRYAFFVCVFSGGWNFRRGIGRSGPHLSLFFQVIGRPGYFLHPVDVSAGCGHGNRVQGPVPGGVRGGALLVKPHSRGISRHPRCITAHSPIRAASAAS